jgi:chemotaxis methyl-accepting protein methylase
MNNVVMRNVIQLVSIHTGLLIHDQEQKYFSNKLYSQMKSLKLNTPEQYYELLLKTANN